MQVIPNASGDFLCMGIAWRIFQYKLANIAFFYNSSLEKECNRIRMKLNSMRSNYYYYYF